MRSAIEKIDNLITNGSAVKLRLVVTRTRQGRA
jgi:hypothetical protein